jgi:hypothetical protein
MGFCLAGVVGDCGSSTSQTVKTFTDVVNQNITNVVNKQGQETEAKQSTVNTIELDMSNSKLENCKFKTSNKIQADQNVKAIANFKSANDIQNVIKLALDKTLESSQKQVNDFLNLAMGNKVESNIESTTKIMNMIQNNVTQESVQKVLAEANALNQQKIAMQNVNCKGSTFEFTNEAIVKQVVDAMTASVMEAVYKTQSDLGVSERTKLIQDQENKGLTDLVKSLTGPLIIIAIVVIAFFLLGGMDVIKGAVGGGDSRGSRDDQEDEEPQYEEDDEDEDGGSGNRRSRRHKGKKKMSKVKIILILLVVIGLCIGGYFAWKKYKGEGFYHYYHYYAVDCKKNPDACTI